MRSRSRRLTFALTLAIRIRPPLTPSDPGFDLIPQRFQRSIAHVTSPTGLAIDSPQGRKLFVLDRVFGQDVQQEGIWEYLSESVNAFVQGYNVSVLAYGQSGSGKSYTMGTSGPLEQADPKMMGELRLFELPRANSGADHAARAPGVIPRAAAALFHQLGGARLDNRNSFSVLRMPKRFSMASVATNATMSAKAKERDWIMKATYVEVRFASSGHHFPRYISDRAYRFTTNSCEIYCSPNPSHRMSVAPSSFVKTQRDAFS